MKSILILLATKPLVIISEPITNFPLTATIPEELVTVEPLESQVKP
jgi:hypothetical protein